MTGGDDGSDVGWVDRDTTGIHHFNRRGLVGAPSSEVTDEAHHLGGAATRTHRHGNAIGHGSARGFETDRNTGVDLGVAGEQAVPALVAGRGRDDDDIGAAGQRARFTVQHWTTRPAGERPRTTEQLEPGRPSGRFCAPAPASTLHKYTGPVVGPRPRRRAARCSDEQPNDAPVLVIHDDRAALPQQCQHGPIQRQDIGLQVRDPRHRGCVDQRVEQVGPQPPPPIRFNRHADLAVPVREHRVPGLTDDSTHRRGRWCENRDQASTPAVLHCRHVGEERASRVIVAEEAPVAVLVAERVVQRGQSRRRHCRGLGE